MNFTKTLLPLITLVLAGLVVFALVRKLVQFEALPVVVKVAPAAAEAPVPVVAPLITPMPTAEVARVAMPAAAETNSTPAEALPAGAIPDEYVFRFFNAADRAAFMRRAQELGIDVLGEMKVGNAVRIRVRDEALLRRLLREGPTAIARGRNYYVRPPDDPLLKKLQPEGNYVALGERLVAWLGLDGPQMDWGRGVTVAVIDTAVGSHPALDEGHVQRVDDYGVAGAGEASAHGTAVASLIAGGGEGVNGVAPGARIISMPVLSGDGVGNSFSLAQAIVDAVGMDADIINLSLGSKGDDPVLRAAVDYALANDVAVVAATGNDAVNAVYYPAAYEGVLAVGASDAEGQHLYFSNYGPAVDIVAPGYGVEAAWSDNQQVLFSGTSAAAPIVSGALAALLSQDSSLTPQEAADVLVATADDAGAPGEDDLYGAGVLDMQRAEDHDARGVVDMALAAPYVAHEGAQGEILRVQVYAQNRGTDMVKQAVLTVNIDGKAQETRGWNLVAGQSVNQTRVIDTTGVQLPHTYVLTTSVVTVGAVDSVSGNNWRQTLLTVGAGGD